MLAVILINCLLFIFCVAPPFIKIDKSLTYSVCLFRSLYHSHKKNFSQKKITSKRANKMKQRPYWSFWKVVFAGYLIRYPGKILKIFGVPLGILLVMIYNAANK